MLLIRLQLRGWLRFLGRGLGTPRGAILALVGLLVFAAWVAQFAFLPRGDVGVPPEQMRLWGSAVLLGFCLLNLLLSSGEQGLYFSPAEVNFLFSGPYTRRQILSYKILFTFLSNGLPAALIFSFIVQIHAAWWLAAFIGLLLGLLFMQLFSLIVYQIAVHAGAQLYSRRRRLAVMVAAIVALAVFAWNREAWSHGQVSEWFRDVQQGQVWQTLTTPLRWFFEAFLTEKGHWGHLLVYTALSLGVNLVLLVIVFMLDVDFLEAAATGSARLYARLQRMRGRPETSGADGVPSTGAVRFSLPALPWLGGVGPIVWRQLTTAIRNWGRLIPVLLVMAIFVLGPVMTASRQPVPEAEIDAATLTMVMMGVTIVFMSLILSSLVPFDFRGDVDRMAVLKSLPLASWRLSLGQVLAPVVLLTLLQCLALVVGSLLLGRTSAMFLVLAAFALPFNFLLLALENLLFLLFPSRLMASTPGDFQTVGRNVVMLLAKMLLLGVVLVVAGLAMGGTYLVLSNVGRIVGPALGWTTGVPMAPLLYVGWIVLAAAGAALVPLLAWAFERYDVGRDTPA
jgi:hypothetical protein